MTQYKWRDRLNRLRNKNLAPVMWLISDDSPQAYKQGLQNQIDYQNQVVDAVDDLVSHYVVCLECDEYYSAQEVNVLVDTNPTGTDAISQGDDHLRLIKR